MLWQRILTAVVLIPIVVLAIFATSDHTFSLIMSAVFAYATWEWSQLSGIKKTICRFGYVIVMLVLMWLSSFVASVIVFCIALAFWIVVMASFVQYSKTGSIKWLQTSWHKAIAGVFVLVPSWLALVVIKSAMGASWVLYSMAIIWVADSAAYFVGRAMGKRKLAEKISPKKTWEGVIGALIAVTIVAFIGAWYLDIPTVMWPSLVIVTIVTAMVSVTGDLFESVLKRLSGVKDSGSFLPGHGGLMDRIDAITAGLPVIALGFYLIGLL